MPRVDVDRQLLFGLLALQTGLVNQGTLFTAFNTWTQDKARSMAEILLAEGHLDVSRCGLLEALVAEHLKMNGGDAEKSLAAIDAGDSTREQLAQLGDPDLGASVAHLGPSDVETALAPPKTVTKGASANESLGFSVGTSSSRGLRFRVLRPHRSGGLGAVFVALDAELNREVALKQILDRHADDPVSRSRFVIEAEITGGLEHPGIVPVYGLGTYGQGRPFYAMRFVRGDSLKDAIVEFHGDPSLRRDPGRRSLELRNLLRRFVDVCNAIEYAHSRGVLHRDIKPANIIVGKHGETLVVDWGLAKAIGRAEPAADSEERTLVPSSTSGSAETLPGSALGTPAFMSPEQARGDLARLGPRSDVYSLGATLYVLLTGRLPFEGNDVGKVLQAVWLGEFQPPRQLQPSIDRALEAVCMKAMARNLEDRYDSPRALADEVERWTADEPVTAWREPVADRVRRWGRRHRTFVGTAAAVLILGVAGLSALAAVIGEKNRMLVAADVATRQMQALADGRLDRAMASIEDYFTGFSADALKGGQLPAALRDRLLARPRAFYEQLAAELAAKQQPSEREQALLAKGQHNLGRILAILGKNKEACAEYGAAIAGYERLVARYHEVPDYDYGLAISQTSLGLALTALGQLREAAASFEKAMAIGEALAARFPDQPRFPDEVAKAQTNLGIALNNMGRSDHSVAAYRSAVKIYTGLAERFPAVADYRGALAVSQTNLGIVLVSTGRPDDAVAAYKQAITIGEALVASHPESVEYQEALARSHGSLGAALVGAGRFDEAASAFEKTVTTYRALAARQPDVPEYQYGVAKSLINLGNIQGMTGRSDLTVSQYESAIAMYEKLVARHPDVPEYQNRLAMGYTNLGIAFAAAGRPGDAVGAYERAAAIYEALVERNPDAPAHKNGLARSHGSLGIALAAMGRPAVAVVALKKAVAIYEALTARHPDVPEYRNGLAKCLNNLGEFLRTEGPIDESAAALKKALAIGAELAARHPDAPEYRDALANYHKNQATLLKVQGNLVESRSAFRKAAQLAVPGTPLAATLPDMLRAAESAVALLDRLPGILKGDDQPRDPAEAVAVAQLCYERSDYAASARLWASAIARDPRLADDRQTQPRYNAACAAALAAAGKGKDRAPSDEAARSQLRAQARAWLEAELATWARVLESAPPQLRAAIGPTLNHWQVDPDLAGIRDPGALAKLPESERNEWRQIWAEVGSLLAKARGTRP